MSTLLAAGVAVGVAVLGILWRLLSVAKKSGVDAQKAKEAAANEIARKQELDRIKAAANAGARVQPRRPGVPNDDPFDLDR